MRFHELLEAAAVPETPYGYWIDPQGQFLVVPFQAHETVIEAHGLDLDEALQQGWLRVVAKNRFSSSQRCTVDMWLGKPTARACGALRSLFASYPFEVHEIEIGGIENINDTDFMCWKKFENANAALGYVKRAAAYRPEEELTEDSDLFEGRHFELPETRYGYWIKDDGEILVVPTFQHGPVAQENGAPAYFDNEIGRNISSYSVALDKGWIRLVTKEQSGWCSIEFQFGRPTVKAFLVLKAIALSGEFEMFQVESNDKTGVRQQYQYSKSFVSPAMMLGYVSEMRRWKEPEKEAPQNHPMDDVAKMFSESLIFEGAIPETSYGYWLSPEGEFHVVGYQNHTGVGRQLGICPIRQNFAHAYGLGWVRIGSNVKEAPNQLFVQFFPGKLTARSISAIRSLARSQEFSKFWNGNKEFDRMGPFLLDVQEKGRAAPQPKPQEQPITEAEVPESDYGYWITDKGEAIAVPEYEHVRAARMHGHRGYREAMKAGWIRVVSNDVEANWFMIEFLEGAPTPRALTTLRHLLKKVDEGYDSYVVDARRNGDLPLLGKSFSAPGPFLIQTAEWARGEHLSEDVELTEGAEIPETEYGYWIDPQGTFHPVTYQNHYPTIRSLGVDGNYVGFDQGWIRVVSDDKHGLPNSLNIEFKALTVKARAIGALRRLATSGRFEKFAAGVHGGFALGVGYGKSFEDPNQFIAYVRRANTPIQQESLVEAELPHSEYGYWVDPQGGCHAVGHQKHIHWIRENTPHVDYMDAFIEGWIRVISKGNDDVPTLSASVLKGRTTRRAISGLRQIATSDEFHNFRLDLLTVRDVDSKHFSSPGSFMNAAMTAGLRPRD